MTTPQILAIAGCSKSSGFGFNKDVWNDCKDSPHLWVNLCHRNIPELQNLHLENKSFGGASNLDIFLQAMNLIKNFDSHVKYLFCAWTSMPRYSFDVGFELYSTFVSTGFVKFPDINLNDINYSSSYLTNTINRFKTLIHIQKEIADLVNYINILKKNAEIFNIKLLNINALCPWDNDFFTYKNYKYPAELSDFTKKEILNVENRNDIEIRNLYNKQHQQYSDYGGIQESTWLNLYNSFYNQQIDVNFDNKHAGIKSNIIYFQQVKKFFETKQLS